MVRTTRTRLEPEIRHRPRRDAGSDVMTSQPVPRVQTRGLLFTFRPGNSRCGKIDAFAKDTDFFFFFFAILSDVYSRVFR